MLTQGKSEPNITWGKARRFWSNIPKVVAMWVPNSSGCAVRRPHLHYTHAPLTAEAWPLPLCSLGHNSRRRGVGSTTGSVACHPSVICSSDDWTVMCSTQLASWQKVLKWKFETDTCSVLNTKPGGIRASVVG